MHTSNLYRIPQAERLAQRLVDATFADSVFFCNSGAEANEGMIKMMRRAMSDAGKPERFRFICFEGAFHGRTLATLAATGNAHYLEGFGPVVEGFDHVPFNNMNAVRDAIGPGTCGIIVEPIQGEGGVRPADMQFLRDLRAVCDEYGIILGMDEVQSGMGRTGKLFAHEWAGITPDVMSSAKGIGGGFPLGAVLAKEQLRQGAGARHAWHDLWRQSAGLRRRQRGARRHAGARLPGRRASARAASCARELDKIAARIPARCSRTRAAWACCSA